MGIQIPVTNDLSLTLGDNTDNRTPYPTARLARGLMLRHRDLDLAEEAVGFGLPVLMRGLEAVFPGHVQLQLRHGSPNWELAAEYTVNLVERLVRPGKEILQASWVYAAKNYLSALRARLPPARGALMNVSSGLRWLLGWKTTFEPADFSAQIEMTYLFDERTGVLSIEADLRRLQPDGITEVMVMNEQGAHYFQEYRDSSGHQFTGKNIGCWDEVTAPEASFASPAQRVAFTAHQVQGARLFRGRELVGSRLAWAGFAYAFPPSGKRLRYDLRIAGLA